MDLDTLCRTNDDSDDDDDDSDEDVSDKSNNVTMVGTGNKNPGKVNIVRDTEVHARRNELPVR